jgi:hypothetical protein
MDLRTYARIIRRFWPIAAGGAFFAVLLGVLSVAHVQGTHLRWRQPLQYQSTSVLLVSADRPWWTMATLPPDSTSDARQAPAPIADPARLSGLAALYAFFVQSDAVRKLVGTSAARHVDAAAVNADLGNGNHDSLPLLQIVATAESGHGAIDLANRATAAFQKFVVGRQVAGAVPTPTRVKLEVMNTASQATLLQGRSYTRPFALVVGVLVMTAILMLAAENLWPSTPGPDGPRDDADDTEPAARAAPPRMVPGAVMATAAPAATASADANTLPAGRHGVRAQRIV